MNSAIDACVAAAFPILETVDWMEPREGDGCWFNLLGARTRENYLPRRWFERINRIGVGELMFEWITILETVLAANDRYVMADLGAGYGRWIVNAALLARRLGRRPFVIGVEAEDSHFSWMEEHVADNQITPAECRLLHAPVTGKRQRVAFPIGHAGEWYGQAVLQSHDAGFGDWPAARVAMRDSLVLDDIINGMAVIDLLDLDIQGMEAEVVPSSIELINQRVKRLHIGTHGREIDDMLRKLMIAAGWRARFDYPCASPDHPTPAGPVDFQDGVQSWINPRFEYSL